VKGPNTESGYAVIISLFIFTLSGLASMLFSFIYICIYILSGLAFIS
jgi:hypothetical protein